MAAAEIGRLRRMLQEPLARRGFHLGVENGNLADHHIGMRQLAREQCVARGFVWQRKVPHLQPSAPLAQGMGDLRKHRSGPRPRAQLLQAAFVDVYERYAFGRSHWRLNTRQTVLVDCLQHPGLCQRSTATRPATNSQATKKTIRRARHSPSDRVIWRSRG